MDVLALSRNIIQLADIAAEQAQQVREHGEMEVCEWILDVLGEIVRKEDGKN
jgi:hypothetical protein